MNLFEQMKSVIIHEFGTPYSQCRYIVVVNDKNYQVNESLAQFIYALKKIFTIEATALYLTGLNKKQYTVGDVDLILKQYIHPLLNNNMKM